MFARLPRRREQEIMDQPGLNVQHHRSALVGLARINAWSASARILWPPLRRLAGAKPRQRLRVLDVASGGGDVAIRLWRQARRAKVELKIDGCDVSATALDHATAQARKSDAPIRFYQWNALRDPIPDGYDAITCSLFLHHLDEAEAVDLLRRLGRAAQRLVLVNDLVRNRNGLALAHVATRILTRSPVVRTDGPLSVHAAFTPSEALDLAERAGLYGATVVRRWPCRFLLSWERRDRNI